MSTMNMMSMWLNYILVILCIVVMIVTATHADISKESLPSHTNLHTHRDHPIKEPHFDKFEPGGEHNVEFDHDAILGSRHSEFEKMEPKDAMIRFTGLIDEMDKNKDDFISRKELTAWVYASFLNLNKEEAYEKMDEHDSDNDGKVTISEYLQKIYGYTIEEIYDFENDKNPAVRELATMMFGDAEKFKTADRDGNGVLTRAEYPAFIHPYDFEFMHKVELKLLLLQYDKNANGLIEFREYMTQPGQIEPGMEEHELLVDQENFSMYDKDDSGSLDPQEVRAWALPDYNDAAKEEAEHLIGLTDKDNDNLLSRAEILEQQELWVGSSATHYGDKLHDPSEL